MNNKEIINNIAKNNISESNIESNASSNNSDEMNKLNERLDQFINNNFNYTYSNNKNNNISLTESNKSNENDMDMEYLMNMINKSNPESDENNDNNENNENEDGINENQIQSLLSKIKNKPNIQVKSFINNKLNNVFNKSSMTEKLLLYNLFSSNKSQKKSVNDNFLENEEFSLNKIFEEETIEKYFQKEVIRFTIENFCKYLKDNGYTIIKNKNEESEDTSKKKEMICPHTDKKHYAKVYVIYAEYVQCLLS